MTREEAIEVLAMFLHKQCDLERTEFAYDANTVWHAVYMASNALEQESCDDCVSRQAVIDIIKKNCVPLEPIIIKHLKALPPVLPKRKQGEWCKQNDDYFDWYECSECGYGSEGEMQYSSEHDVRTKYCPNCGAKMESEDKE